MITLKILAGMVLFIAFVVELTIMIILERDKPRNMIVWCVVFLLTNVVGGVIYALFRVVFYLKHESLQVKAREDEVFKSLIAGELFENDVEPDGEFYEFNKMAFNANITTNNNFELIDGYAKFKENLLKDINAATRYIFFEVTKVNAQDFVNIKDALIVKAESGLNVRFVYDRLNNRKLLKDLRAGGVKVYRFSKHNTVGKVYSNVRNCVSIDGKVCYFGNFNINNRQIEGKVDCLNTYIKFKGDVVQDIDLAVHQDLIFASNKFIEYTAPKQENYASECKIQFVSNEINNNIELLFIKAITMAKSSIQLQLGEFVPTESLMSLLRFAIDSNISVKLMVPLKTPNLDKLYAYRAYAKELALYGSDVYLYDGYICNNAITVDNDYVLCGSFVLDREHLAKSLQNVAIINDSKAVNYFNKLFNLGIENSYKIANAKYMLMREKFFKNFV